MGLNIDTLIGIIVGILAVAALWYQNSSIESRLKSNLDDMRVSLKKTAVILHEYRKFRAAFDSSYDAMVIADREGKVLFMNDSAIRITGFSREESIGKKAGALWGGLMPKKFYQAMWRRIKTEKKPYHGRITNHRKNGQKYTTDMSITPVFDDARAEVEFFVAVERDLSESRDV